MPIAPNTDGVIATRRLRWSRGGVAKTLTARIGVPRRVRPGEWACPYWISGFGGQAEFKARGVDSVQALVLALEGVRIKLIEQGGHASWEGGTTGGGFPRYVPDYHGRGFSEKLEALIDRELLRFARAAEAKHKKRKKKKATANQ